MFVPREIFQLIEPKSISLFLTCSSFLTFVDVFYRKYNVDVETNTSKFLNNFLKNTIIKIKPKNQSSHLVNYDNVYNLINSPVIPCERFKNLSQISFSDSFNKSVDNLPERLISLTFGNSFNKSVDNLPKTLTSLTFGYHFNQSVDNLPETLISLNFGNSFNQSVDNLPIGFWFTKNIDIINFWLFLQPISRQSSRNIDIIEFW
jgi:hypothetical protein